MAASSRDDAFSKFDQLLGDRLSQDSNPWSPGTFVADLDLLRMLISIPIGLGESQESGRPAKALDAWVAHELRRAGFPTDAIWPRLRRPRVLAQELSGVEGALRHLGDSLSTHEASFGKLKPRELRQAIIDACASLPRTRDAYVLGDFYAKQIDVGMSSWQAGPQVLISTKTMFSSYRNNLRNRHEEAVGEVSSLRRRHPMAAMGYVYLVRRNIFDVDGAYAILYDILTRLRRPGETFDATMLLVADWDDGADTPTISTIDQPADELSASRFFADLVDAVTDRSPISEHQSVRLRRGAALAGGLPEEGAFDLSSDDIDDEEPR